MHRVFQLKLAIVGSEPLIWRRVFVEDDCTFGDLHHVIQYAFYWLEHPPHEFTIQGRSEGPRIGPSRVEDTDADDVRLREAIESVGDEMRYRCKSGDRWVVDVHVEGLQPITSGHRYPYCSSGACDRPPRGVGGIAKHNEAARAFGRPEAWKAFRARNPNARCFDQPFDPTYLDIGDINTALGLIFPPRADPPEFDQSGVFSQLKEQ